MDSDETDFETFRDCLVDLSRVNQLTFAYRPTLRFFETLARCGLLPRDRTIAIIDVGSGYGDMLRKIDGWAQGRGLRVDLTGVDLNPWSARAAGRSDRGRAADPLRHRQHLRLSTGAARRHRHQLAVDAPSRQRLARSLHRVDGGDGRDRLVRERFASQGRSLSSLSASLRGRCAFTSSCSMTGRSRSPARSTLPTGGVSSMLPACYRRRPGSAGCFRTGSASHGCADEGDDASAGDRRWNRRRRHCRAARPRAGATSC